VSVLNSHEKAALERVLHVKDDLGCHVVELTCKYAFDGENRGDWGRSRCVVSMQPASSNSRFLFQPIPTTLALVQLERQHAIP